VSPGLGVKTVLVCGETKFLSRENAAVGVYKVNCFLGKRNAMSNGIKRRFTIKPGRLTGLGMHVTPVNEVLA